MKILILTFFSLYLSGCLITVKPLSMEEPNKADLSLCGLWKLKNDDVNNNTYLHLIRNLTGTGMKAVYVNHPVSTSGGTGQYIVELFPTHSNKRSYVNIEVGNSYSEKKDSTGYMVFCYKLESKDTLKVWLPMYESLKDAVDKGKLKGKAWETTWGTNVIITGDPKVYLKWLDDADLEKDFDLFGKFKALEKSEFKNLER